MEFGAPLVVSCTFQAHNRGTRLTSSVSTRQRVASRAGRPSASTSVYRQPSRVQRAEKNGVLSLGSMPARQLKILLSAKVGVLESREHFSRALVKF